MDYIALKNEITTDPAGLGYAALSAVGNDQGIADALNIVRTGTAADGKSYSIFRDDIAPREIINCIQTVDFNSLTQLQVSKLQMLFSSAPIDATLANVRSNFLAIFSGASSGTTTALSAVASRNGSRAEVLFGIGTTIEASDVAQALKS